MQQTYEQQPYPQQLPQQHYPMQMPMAAPQKKRNVAMIVIGGLLIFLALFPSGVFFYNLWQYATVADRWANDPMLSPEARDFGIEIIQNAAMGRMMIFGPVAFVFWMLGLVLGGLGLRKK